MAGFLSFFGVVSIISAFNCSEKAEKTDLGRLTRVLGLGIFGIGLMMFAIIFQLELVINHLKG